MNYRDRFDQMEECDSTVEIQILAYNSIIHIYAIRKPDYFVKFLNVLGQNGSHFNLTIWKPHKMVRFYNGILFLPFTFRNPKYPVFKCFQNSNGRYSDRHCISQCSLLFDGSNPTSGSCREMIFSLDDKYVTNKEFWFLFNRVRIPHMRKFQISLKEKKETLYLFFHNESK